MRDYASNLGNKGLSLIAGFLTSVMLARYLGVALRGELSFITQLSGLLAILLGLGLNQTFPYYFRRKPNRETYEIFVRYFVLQGVVYALIGTVAVIVTHNQTVFLLALMTVTAVGYQQMESTMAAFDVRLKIRVNIALSTARIILTGVIVVLLPRSLLWPVLLQAGLWLAVVFTYVLATRAKVGSPVSAAHLKGVLRFSWLPMLTAALVVMNYNVDTLMLKALGTQEQLGLYAVAAGLITYFWAVPDAIKEVLVSRVVRSNNPRAILPPLRVAVAATLLTIIAFITVGYWLIPLMYGIEFAGSYSLAAILSLGVISMTYYKVIGVLLLAEGKRGYYFGTLAAAVLTNTTLNLFAIPAYGAVGAAWTSVISYSLTGGLFIFYFCRTKRIKLRELAFPTRADFKSIRAALRR